METDFIYWRHPTPPGIKVEEVCGGEDKHGKLWREMALQVYCENGREGYRQLAHYDTGAPYLYGEQQRISITHTQGLLAVATLPKTPEANLSEFSERAALGIDAERLDREQLLRVRERYLSAPELTLVDAESLEANAIAWTAKEALYKAALTPGLDFRTNIIIDKLPALHQNPADHKSPAPIYGEAHINFPDGRQLPFTLYSYESEGCCITIAYSPKCAKFGRNANAAN